MYLYGMQASYETATRGLTEGGIAASESMAYSGVIFHGALKNCRH